MDVTDLVREGHRLVTECHPLISTIDEVLLAEMAGDCTCGWINHHPTLSPSDAHATHVRSEIRKALSHMSDGTQNA